MFCRLSVLLVGLLVSGIAAIPAVAQRSKPTIVRASNQTVEYPKVVNTAFQPGERLKYNLRYGVFKAGEAIFRIDEQMPAVEGRPTYHILGSGRSTGTFDFFYTVRDEFETWVDPESMLPIKYYRKVHEGNTRWQDNVTFDHQNGKIRGKKGEFDAVRWTRDMLSALYYARCLDIQGFEEKRFYEIPTFLDDKVHRLGMRILGRETIKIGMGTFKCIKISPRVVASTVFKEEDAMMIWVTDDENLIPVKIYSPIIVGNVNAELTEFSGLRHPLTAKIK